mmetsp:Transcript_46804/g.138301  ORF Transcript_46804/g.138301 Transcript_46804/m.138301 type:complete len:314 (-) Transcript_46804:87-1028(-)
MGRLLQGVRGPLQGRALRLPRAEADAEVPAAAPRGQRRPRRVDDGSVPAVRGELEHVLLAGVLLRGGRDRDPRRLARRLPRALGDRPGLPGQPQRRHEEDQRERLVRRPLPGRARALARGGRGHADGRGGRAERGGRQVAPGCRKLVQGVQPRRLGGLRPLRLRGDGRHDPPPPALPGHPAGAPARDRHQDVLEGAGRRPIRRGHRDRVHDLHAAHGGEARQRELASGGGRLRGPARPGVPERGPAEGQDADRQGARAALGGPAARAPRADRGGLARRRVRMGLVQRRAGGLQAWRGRRRRRRRLRGLAAPGP